MGTVTNMYAPETSESRTVFTFCRICSARCGLAVKVSGNTVDRIAPDKANPYTWRDFCVKGRSAHEMVSHPRRILQPMRRTGHEYVETSWDEAITSIAETLERLIERYGPDTVATYTGNPSYASMGAQLYMRAFLAAIGSGNHYDVGSVDTNAYSVATKAMYGIPKVSFGYDIDACKCFL